MATKFKVTGLIYFTVQTNKLCPEKFVDSVWYIKYITARNDEERDILVEFMERERDKII